MHLPDNVPRSGGAAISREHVGPGAHTAAPGLIPGAGQLDKSDHCSTPSLRTPPPKPSRRTMPCRRIPPKRNRSARTAKEKARSRRGTGSFAANDVAAAASSGDRHRRTDRTERSTRPPAPGIRALRNLQNACADAHEKFVHPLPHPCLGYLQISPHSNEEKSLFE
jgi:hypothetical protein